MNTDKKLQAKNLYLQTELTKTQIADLLNISRRSLHYWIREGSWQRLKESAAHLPAILAENCYHIFGHLTEHYLSELRATNPVSHKEADTLHKLVLTIGKLKNRSTLNENMEMFGFFLDGLKQRNPTLAAEIAPYVDEYITSRASVYISQLAPDNFNNQGRIPWKETDYEEQQLDQRDLFDEDIERMDALEAARQPTIPQPEIPADSHRQPESSPVTMS